MTAGPNPSQADSRESRAAFYCVVSAEYFLGAVGTINSLRLVGHSEPIYALSCGLSPAQRALLEPEVTLVEAPPGREPFTLKSHAPLTHPAEVMILIDADMAVVRPLGALVERAAGGCVVAFENPVDRFVPEWAELLDFEAIERRRYLCSGLVAFDRSLGETVLRLVDDRLARVDFKRSYFGEGNQEYPLTFADQDVLNAVLAARVEARWVVSLDSRLAPMPPFDGLRIVDAERLQCVGEGDIQPYLVHQSLPWKPWLEPIYDGIYSRLLRRLLVGPDIAIRVPAGDIPLTLRSGVRAAAKRRRVNAREQLRWRLDGLRRERSTVRPADRERPG
jgi:hypothetical protein